MPKHRTFMRDFSSRSGTVCCIFSCCSVGSGDVSLQQPFLLPFALRMTRYWPGCILTTRASRRSYPLLGESLLFCSHFLSGEDCALDRLRRVVLRCRK